MMKLFLGQIFNFKSGIYVIFYLEMQYFVYLFANRNQNETFDSNFQAHVNHTNFKDNLVEIFEVKVFNVYIYMLLNTNLIYKYL